MQSDNGSTSFRPIRKPGNTCDFPLPLFVLALPLLEIAGFVVVGRQIGVLPTLGLVLASGYRRR